VNQRHIQGQDAALEKEGKLRKQDRREICPSLLYRFTGVGANEHGIHAQMAAHFWPNIIRRADGERMDQLHVLQVGRISHQGLEQFLRHGNVAGHENPLIRLNSLHRFCC